MPDEHAEAPGSIADALDQGQAEPEAPDSSGQATEPESPSYFDEETRFDPATLPDPLREQYNSMRADYTRKTQSLAEQRQEAEQALALREALLDPEQAPELLQALGYEVEDDDEAPDFDPGEFEDPSEARLTAMEEYLQGQAEAAEIAAAQEAEEESFWSELEQIQQQTGREFDDDELRAIAALADGFRDAEGNLGVRDAYEHLYTKILPKERKRYTDSKRPPHVPPAGSSATEDTDLDLSGEERVDRMVEAAENAS